MRPIETRQEIRPIAVREEVEEFDADGWPIERPLRTEASEEARARVHELLHKAVSLGNHTYSIAQLVGIYPA